MRFNGARKKRKRQPKSKHVDKKRKNNVFGRRLAASEKVLSYTKGDGSEVAKKVRWVKNGGQQPVNENGTDLGGRKGALGHGGKSQEDRMFGQGQKRGRERGDVRPGRTWWGGGPQTGNRGGNGPRGTRKETKELE